MNILKTIAAAGLLLSTATIATSANAQDYHHDRGHHYGWDRGRHNGWDRGGGWNNGYGWHRTHYGWGGHRRCWTEWRWHRRVRVCN